MVALACRVEYCNRVNWYCRHETVSWLLSYYTHELAGSQTEPSSSECFSPWLIAGCGGGRSVAKWNRGRVGAHQNDGGPDHVDLSLRDGWCSSHWYYYRSQRGDKESSHSLHPYLFRFRACMSCTLGCKVRAIVARSTLSSSLRPHEHFQ